MSAWAEYKKKLGDTRPWDLMKPEERVSDEIESTRFSICMDCPELIKVTNQCKQCGCFMKLKVKLKSSTCPIGNW